MAQSSLYVHTACNRTATTCTFLFVLLTVSLITAVAGVPAYAPNTIPDKWHQLLQADRYSLVQLPPRQLHGDPSHPSQLHTLQRPILQNRSTVKIPSVRVIPLQSDLSHGITSRVKYEGPSGTSQFVCEVVNAPNGLDVKSAVAIALGTMSSTWSSLVVVTMLLQFDNLGNESILATGGGAYFVQLGDSLPDGIIIPIGSAEAIRGVDLNGDKEGNEKYDVLVTVNTVTPWYAGNGGPSDDTQYDLATVLLHEIYHNLVFSGSVVAEKKTVAGTVQQTAYLYKGYKTRFDMFLATQSGCGVLQYLTSEELASATGKTTGQLLAEAVCSNLLYFASGNTVIAKLHAPKVFQYRSSIYHIDQYDIDESLMFPTIPRGSFQHKVGPKIKSIQSITLDASSSGSSTSCQLPPPTMNPDQSDGVYYVHTNQTRSPNLLPTDEPTRVAGLPTWGLVLLIILAIILFILLLLLCLLLCLKGKRRQTERRSEIRSSRYSSLISGGKGGRTTSSSRKESGAGKKSSDSWSKWSKHTRSSRHSKHSRHSRHSKASSRKPESERHPCKKDNKCPSTGKNIYVCCCECCTPPLTRPPPIASVHQWEPDSVASVGREEQCRRRKRKHCRHRHDHHHGVQKVVKKVCKSKTVCPPGATSSKKCAKTTKCTTTVTKKPCRVVPSTKPPQEVAGCSSGVERVKCKRRPSTSAADYCVQRAPCVPVAPVCVPAAPACVPVAPACVPAAPVCRPTTYTSRNCTPTRSRSQKNCTTTTRTCTPTASTSKSCKTCKRTRKNCCCENKVEVNVEYRC